jgi:tetratricopeptide (TPR) repeat protein
VRRKERMEKKEGWGLLEEGWEKVRSGGYREGVRAFREAEEIEPGIASLKRGIASCHYFQREFREGLEIFESLVREGDLGALVGVGACAFELREWDKSLVAARAAYQRDPASPSALQWLGAVLGEFGRYEEQLVLLERAVKLAPWDPEIRVRLGLRQLEGGDYERGWRTFEARFELGGDLSVGRWCGERMAGKNIVIFNEPWMGLGDAVLFVRYLPELAERARDEGGLILLVVEEALYDLFARTLAGDGKEVFVTTLRRGQPWGLED